MSTATTLPPGPKLPKFVIGLIVLSGQRSLLRLLQRRYGDAFLVDLPALGRSVVCSRPDLVKQIFTAPNDVLKFGESSPLGAVLGPGSLFSLDGYEHLRERKLLLPPVPGARTTSY